MTRNVDRWIGTIARSPLLLLGLVLVNGYKILFSWWLEGILAHRDEDKLERDIRDAMPFLFDARHAKRVPNQGIRFPPPLDGAFVTLAVDNLLVRFCRGKGDLDVRIASRESPTRWFELSLILSLIDDNLKRENTADLWRVSSLLEPRLDRLAEAVVGEMDPNLERRLAEVRAEDRVAIRQAEWELRKRFPGA